MSRWTANTQVMLSTLRLSRTAFQGRSVVFEAPVAFRAPASVAVEGLAGRAGSIHSRVVPVVSAANLARVWAVAEADEVVAD